MKRKLLRVFDPAFDRRPLAVRPFVIAEAGVNHEGSLEVAQRLIDDATAGGADAIKFQTYRANTLAVRDSPAYWDLSQERSTSQYELFSRYDKFWRHEFEVLKSYCDGAGIEFMSTPFDAESAHFINDLVGVHKISSSDITNRPFVELVASFGKPILLSTGASTRAEIEQAVGWVRAEQAPLALLHCVLNYPTREELAELGDIVLLRELFPDTVIGYSDHTIPSDLEALVVAASLGAAVIEKHFTHDRTLPGNDHYHAMDRELLLRLVERLERATTLAGRYQLDDRESEEAARQHARRSLVTTIPLPKGTRIEAGHLTWKRPAHGISPAEIAKVVGRVTAADLAADTVLRWEDIA